MSGRLSIRLFRTSDGQWFLTIEPDNKNDRQQYTCIDSETALCWLEKHSFNRQIKEYFGISDNLLQPERQVLVAEWKSPNSTTSHDLIHVEQLYLSPMNTNTHLFILHDTVSAAPLVLKKGIDTYSLKNHLAFFQDNNGTAGIDKIESPDFQDNFVRGNQGTFQQTDLLVPVWIRFTLDFSELSKKSVNNKWMLRFSWPFIQMIELYGKNRNGIWEKKKAGIIYTFQEPYGHEKFIALDLNSPKNDLATYYVRIVAHDSVPTTLEIYSKDAVFTKARFIYEFTVVDALAKSTIFSLR